MKQMHIISTSFFVFCSLSNPVLAQQQSEEDELAAAFGDKTIVSIATGGPQPIAKAPASATVITARDIEAMGATDLREVLESVPGIHVSTSPIAYNPRFFIRGIASAFTPGVLFLVNGFRINTIFQGNPSLFTSVLPVRNIARIEAIRGPGSALYGADAFSGVINIITKSSADINGTIIGARLGSFQEKAAWFQYGGKLGIFDAAISLEIGETDGQKRIIERDAATLLDAIFNTRTSNAPGPVSLASQSIDAQIDLAYENWRFRLSVEDRKTGSGAGLAEALDPNSEVPEQRINSNLIYRKNNLIPNTDFDFSLNFSQLVERPANPSFTLLPPGSLGGAFPDGVIGNPGHSEKALRFASTGFYTGLKTHKIRFGIGREVSDLYHIEEIKNFAFINGVLTPLGKLVESAGNPDLIFSLPQTRTLSYAFVQDEWNFAKDFNLTAGVRHDRYSDFGTTTNPRFALVWDAAFNLTIKGLFGKAFRAPSFANQANRNNPVTNGNPNIKPERIETKELIFAYQPTPTLQTSATFFKYRQSEIILFIPDATGATAQNAGDQTGRGVELESTWDFSKTLRLSGNYSYQRSIDETTQKNAGLAPQHRLFLRSDWRFAPSWQFGTTINYVADRKREPSDTRPKIADYTTVDLNLRKEKAIGNWDVQIAVKNLFDRDVREPTLAPGNIPGDLPLANRSFFAKISYKFQ